MSTDWAAHDLTVQNHHGGNLAATSRIRHVLIAAITAGDIGAKVLCALWRLKHLNISTVCRCAIISIVKQVGLAVL